MDRPAGGVQPTARTRTLGRAAPILAAIVAPAGVAGQVTVIAETNVDGRGKYLVPGLWDMHVHTSTDRITREILFPVLVAHGITGIRSMAADCLEFGEPDCGDTGYPGIYWGSTLHEELRLLVSAGMTEAEALQAATSGPAEFLGMGDELGSVEEGKRADLVLLGADPLDDTSNTERSEAVLSRGRLFDRAVLDAMLVAASTAARAN